MGLAHRSTARPRASRARNRSRRPNRARNVSRSLFVRPRVARAVDTTRRSARDTRGTRRTRPRSLARGGLSRPCVSSPIDSARPGGTEVAERARAISSAIREGLEERKWDEVRLYINEVAKALDRASNNINSASRILNEN